MPTTRLIATLLFLLDRARTAERTFMAGLGEDERVLSGTPEHWSGKDLVAHVTAWHTYLADLLTAAMRGESPARFADFNERNAHTFAENAGKPWAQVEVEAEEAAARLSGLLPQLGDEDLLEPARFAWRRGQPLAPAVVRPLYWHPMLHLSENYARRGDAAAVQAIRADLEKAAGELAVLPELRGNTLYMIASSYAAEGKVAEALAALREALALAPNLVDWSKRDPGLQPLRADPGYAALYG
jgi:hypothetical protein